MQTSQPTDIAIQCAARHDYLRFVASEDAQRRSEMDPPYGRLIRVLFEDEDEARVAATAEEFGRRVKAAVGDEVEVKGPQVAMLAMLRGRHRHNMLLKAPLASPALERAKSVLVELAAQTSRTHVAIDVDPVSMF